MIPTVTMMMMNSNLLMTGFLIIFLAAQLSDEINNRRQRVRRFGAICAAAFAVDEFQQAAEPPQFVDYHGVGAGGDSSTGATAAHKFRYGHSGNVRGGAQIAFFLRRHSYMKIISKHIISLRAVRGRGAKPPQD